jgi:hypothetical protein
MCHLHAYQQMAISITHGACPQDHLEEKSFDERGLLDKLPSDIKADMQNHIYQHLR